MTRDASLDEFAGGGDDEDYEEAAGAEDATDGAADTTEDGDGARAGDEDGAGEVDTTTADGDMDGTDVPAPGTEDDAPDEPEWLPPAEVEPARSTYDWSPGGAECAACGATVEARWRDESGLVCADCKAW